MSATSRIAIVLAAMAIGLSACGTGGPRRIVVAARELPDGLDPVRVSKPADENACELVFDGLVNIAANDSGTASPVLGLAESIAQDQADRSIYRIRLREARWHDGRALDSSDVVSSFAAYVEPANRSPRREYLLGLVASVERDGPRGVVVRFLEPIAEFRAWYVLAFKIVPRLYRGEAMPGDRTGPAGAAFAASPVGTGPFRLESRRANELAFAAEPSSWRGAPSSAGIAIRRIPESRDRIRAFLAGKVDMIADTSPLDRPQLESAGDVMVQSYMPQAFYSVAINLRRPVLSERAARTALVSAIDRPSLVPGLTDRGAGVQLNSGPFPDGLLAAVLPEYFAQGFPNRQPRDLAQAARLARGSGLSGAALKIAFPASWGAFGTTLASNLATQLALAEIKAKPEQLPDAEYARALAARDFDLAIVYHEGFDNLFSGISALYRSGSPDNETGIADPALDGLLSRREADVEVTAWIDDTLALHDLVSAVAPYIPLFTIEKDLFYRGLNGILIASDNPFLTAERWSLASK